MRLFTPRRTAAIFVVLVLVWILCGVYGPRSTTRDRPITVGKDTTWLLGPLDAEGYVDYVAAINQRNQQGVTAENNAWAMLLRAVNLRALERADRERLFAALGIVEPDDEITYFESFERFVGNLADLDSGDRANTVTELNRQFDVAQHRPWKAAEFPQVARWLQEMAGPLALAIEAAERPKSFFPLSLDNAPGARIKDAIIPSWDAIRLLPRSFVARAMLRLESKQFDAAWRDIATAHRLARHTGQGSLLIDAIVANSMERSCRPALAAFAHHAEVSPDDWARYRRELATLPLAPAMAQRFDECERLVYLDTVTSMARAPNDNELLEEIAGAGNVLMKARQAIGMDYDLILRRGNILYDRVVELSALPHGADRMIALKALRIESDSQNDDAGFSRQACKVFLGQGKRLISEQVADALEGVTLRWLEGALNAEDRAATERTLSEMALALAAYRAEHGSYPPTLESLAPKFIAAAPRDRLSDGPLRYRRTEQGYLLYSVGLNGIDDGGRAEVEDIEDADYGRFDDLIIQQPYQEPPPKASEPLPETP